MLKIGVLCSGQPGLHTLRQLLADRPVEFVLTDPRSSSIVEFCHANSISVFAGNPRKGAAGNFRRLPVDVIVSVNYLYIVEQDIIDYATRLAFNIHGSLLPKYRGRTPHVWAIINNEKQVGVTAHKMALRCDAGDIIEQTVVPLSDDDTGGSVLQKLKQLYYPVIQRVMGQVESGQLTTRPQDESRATWFGKRTPDDGQINWSWCRERIRNWVRALADPYPGAFTWYNNRKIVIDRVSFSDAGFDASMVNGTLLQSSPLPVVKTATGTLSIESIRQKIDFAPKTIFGNQSPATVHHPEIRMSA